MGVRRELRRRLLGRPEVAGRGAQPAFDWELEGVVSRSQSADAAAAGVRGLGADACPAGIARRRAARGPGDFGGAAAGGLDRAGAGDPDAEQKTGHFDDGMALQPDAAQSASFALRPFSGTKFRWDFEGAAGLATAREFGSAWVRLRHLDESSARRYLDGGSATRYLLAECEKLTAEVWESGEAQLGSRAAARRLGTGADGCRAMRWRLEGQGHLGFERHSDLLGCANLGPAGLERALAGSRCLFAARQIVGVCLRAGAPALENFYGPPVLTLVGVDWYRPPCGLRRALAELRRRLPRAAAAGECPLAWAQREQAAGRHRALSQDELAAVRCCLQQEQPDLFLCLNQALFDWEPGQAGSDFDAWESLAAHALPGLARLRQPAEHTVDEPLLPGRGVSCGRLERAAHLRPEELQLLRRQVGQEVCFAGLQSAAATSPTWILSDCPPGHVPCILQFEGSAAAEGVDVSAFSDEQPETEFLLPPYLHCRVLGIETALAQGSADVATEVLRIRLSGTRMPPPLPRVLAAPDEDVLVAALFVGLHCRPWRRRRSSPRFTSETAPLAAAALAKALETNTGAALSQ
ncbi:unnamed protein product [Prorocentrum cordatum]|uniref:Uncharacterized protein n=1 Tax=Prorocentrum cordatum TaxID=2364126 RepID=A0ABN9T8R8_9DINO|nr:unnamed protein product [Polarella glacialis]